MCIQSYPDALSSTQIEKSKTGWDFWIDGSHLSAGRDGKDWRFLTAANQEETSTIGYDDREAYSRRQTLFSVLQSRCSYRQGSRIAGIIFVIAVCQVNIAFEFQITIKFAAGLKQRDHGFKGSVFRRPGNQKPARRKDTDLPRIKSEIEGYGLDVGP